MPFRYESTGVETHFTNGLEPDAASHNVFAFHKPETLAGWLGKNNETVKGRLRQMPPLAQEGLRKAQITAIKNLEVSLARGDRRALIQMATGGGKTFTACNFIYRLIKYAGARRVLFLVDRNNLGRQTLKEFQAFKTPDEQRPFTELYNVQHMQSNKLDGVSKVCISTIQRLYAMLQGKETRRVRWEKADEDIRYDADELDRRIVSKDQIRTILQAFRDKLFTEIFKGRTEVPKTLIFAKDDSHAEDIVTTVREVFGKGNDFAQKITYRAGTARVVERVRAEDGSEQEQVRWVNTGAKPEDLISSFRNSYNPRIAVTVDMISTGTDIKPLEIVFFMRAVRSRTLFEQMKGRGSRTISPDELRGVRGDAPTPM